jgi:two-component system, NarL family, invasion response regulator UvrY
MKNDLKIMIADDHLQVREHIKEVTFGEASEGSEALVRIMESSWDLIILDVSMPQKNGLEIVSEMRRKNIPTPVVMISMHAADYYAPRALKAGANAFIEKSNSALELVASVKGLIAQ